MTSVEKLRGLDKDIVGLMESRLFASAQALTGDTAGAAATLQQAWKPLENVPPSLIAARIAVIGIGTFEKEKGGHAK